MHSVEVYLLTAFPVSYMYQFHFQDFMPYDIIFFPLSEVILCIFGAAYFNT